MNLYEIRKATSLTDVEIAKQLDIDVAEYKQIEKGIVEPTIAQAIKLADFFDITVDAVLGRKSKLKLSSGEYIWHNIRKSLPKDKLETIAQMINGVGGLELSDSDIENICDISNDQIENFDEAKQISQLFAPKDDSEMLSFDDYLVIQKIIAGEKIPIDNFDSNSVTTSYSFTHNGKLYNKSMVSRILSKLFHKFHLLNFDMCFDTQKCEICSTYPKLNRKAKALLKGKASEYKELK